MALVNLQDVSVRYGEQPVLDGISLTVEPGERIGLVGRNGAGKSTLLRLIHGDVSADEGAVVRQQGLVVAMLTQEVPRELAGTVYDEVARGLGEQAALITAYHAAGVQYSQSHE